MKYKLLEEEIWKDIEGYEGLYQVSNLGRVKSLERKVNGKWGKMKIKEKILVAVNDKDGYKIVTLCKGGKQKVGKIHRLVAKTFISNPNNFLYINHKDENKSNNNVDNLEWCTAKYNTNYGTNLKKIIEKKLKPVLQYNLDGNLIAEYRSMSDAYKTTNISHIYDCCNKKLKTCGGYIWRYKNEG
jgi:hypothetical protein